eukprot:scaffold6647_cov166-Amphora_coffeaeformis.AAC.5
MKPGILRTCGGKDRLTLSQFKAVFQKAKQGTKARKNLVRIVKSLEKLFDRFPSSFLSKTSIITDGRTSQSSSHRTEKSPRQSKATSPLRADKTSKSKRIAADESDGTQPSCPFRESETIVHSRKRISDTDPCLPTKKQKGKPSSKIRIGVSLTPEQATDRLMLQSPLWANCKILHAVVYAEGTRHHWWGRHLVRVKSQPSYKIRIGESILPPGTDASEFLKPSKQKRKIKEYY